MEKIKITKHLIEAEAKKKYKTAPNHPLHSHFNNQQRVKRSAFFEGAKFILNLIK